MPMLVKVEPIRGDATRARGPFPGGTPDPEASGLFVYLNANKRGVTLELEHPEGRAVLDQAVALRGRGPYVLQAAIASVQTDDPIGWTEIAALYGELARRAPSPVIEVNRAVAVGLADGPLAGLAVLAPVLASGELDGYAPLHSVHADLLDRAGRAGEAAAAWARAIETTDNAALRDALERRVARGGEQDRPGA